MHTSPRPFLGLPPVTIMAWRHQWSRSRVILMFVANVKIHQPGLNTVCAEYSRCGCGGDRQGSTHVEIWRASARACTCVGTHTLTEIFTQLIDKAGSLINLISCAKTTQNPREESLKECVNHDDESRQESETHTKPMRSSFGGENGTCYPLHSQCARTNHNRLTSINENYLHTKALKHWRLVSLKVMKKVQKAVTVLSEIVDAPLF